MFMVGQKNYNSQQPLSVNSANKVLVVARFNLSAACCKTLRLSQTIDNICKLCKKKLFHTNGNESKLFLHTLTVYPIR